MSDQTITSLIEKLEGAEVGSRELDAEIARLFGWTQENIWRDPTFRNGDWYGPDSYVPQRCPPTFSTSLDAALALAERLGHDVFGIMADVIERLERDGWSGFPAPGLQSALARYFCAAILRAQSEARAAGEDSPANEGEGGR